MSDIELKAISHEIYKEACFALHYGKAESCVFLCNEKFYNELKDYMSRHLCLGLSRYGTKIKLHGIEIIPIPDYLYRYPCPYRLMTDFDVTKIMNEKLGGQ